MFTDYEDPTDDPKEADADQWAWDTLVSLDQELEFRSATPKPQIWQLKAYAQRLKVHPAIAAEIFNKRAGKEVISYAYLKTQGLFPQLTAEQAELLMRA